MTNFLSTEEEQVKYSIAKLPELYQRKNDLIEARRDEDEKLDGKIRRHEKIVKHGEVDE